MQAIDVCMIENNTTPPRPIPVDGLDDEIEVTGSSPKARKCRIITATMNNFKS
jgi:hypothetical protein